MRISESSKSVIKGSDNVASRSARKFSEPLKLKSARQSDRRFANICRLWPSSLMLIPLASEHFEPSSYLLIYWKSVTRFKAGFRNLFCEIPVRAETVLRVRGHELGGGYSLAKISAVLSARALHVPRTDMIAYSSLGMKLSVW